MKKSYSTAYRLRALEVDRIKIRIGNEYKRHILLPLMYLLVPGSDERRAWVGVTVVILTQGTFSQIPSRKASVFVVLIG